MTRRRKWALIAVLVAFEMLVCAAIVWSLGLARPPMPPTRTRFFYFANTRAEERIEKRFAVRAGRPAALDLSNTRGDVQITGHDGDEFVITAVKEAWGQGRRDAQAKVEAIQVKMDMSDNTLSIVVVDPEDEIAGVFVGSHRSSQVRFEIKAPRQTSVSVHAEHGEIELAGTEGDADLLNRYADIVIENVVGTISAETNNGDVMVRRAGGEGTTVSLKSRYGEIHVAEATGKVAAETSNGGVTVRRVGGSDPQVSVQNRYGSIEVEDVAGDVTAETENGEIVVRRAGGKDASIRVSTRYQDIQLSEVEAGELSIACQNGKLALDRVTVGGDLALDTRYVDIEMNEVRARSLDVNGKNGDITLDDVELEGGLEISIEYGAVSLTRTEASGYRIDTKNAPITLDGGHGLLYLHTSYGDIEVENAHDATLDLAAKNGKVSFEGALSMEADHRVESEYGDVLLRLPPDTAVYLEASTRYGEIRCDFDVLVKQEGGQVDSRSNESSLRGTINQGDVTLRIETRNGSIHVESTP